LREALVDRDEVMLDRRGVREGDTAEGGEDGKETQ
jgi:hypothetical protein